MEPRKGTIEIEMTIPLPSMHVKARPRKADDEVVSGSGRWVVPGPDGLRAYRKRAFARQAARYWDGRTLFLFDQGVLVALMSGAFRRPARQSLAVECSVVGEEAVSGPLDKLAATLDRATRRRGTVIKVAPELLAEDGLPFPKREWIHVDAGDGRTDVLFMEDPEDLPRIGWRKDGDPVQPLPSGPVELPHDREEEGEGYA